MFGTTGAGIPQEKATFITTKALPPMTTVMTIISMG
jgi:hypothetical protein